MTGYFLRRTLRAVITLWVAVTFFFFLLRVDVNIGLLALNMNASQEAIDSFNTRWGFDKSLLDQYWLWITGALQGDFGYSFRDARPAADWVAERLPKTLELSLAGFALMIVIGVPAGLAAAIRNGTATDRTIMSLAAAGYSLPSFVLGLALMYTFAVYLQLLPSTGSTSFAHLILPAATYGLTGSAGIARFTRAAMLEVLGKPYIAAARASGAPPAAVVLRHAVPNAAIPVVTMLGFSVGQLVGHAVIVETVFAWPGLGQALISAVANRDLAVVQVLVVVFATFMIGANLLVDILYGVLDPRIRTAGGANG
ncbi:ABC transporter permease [Roseibium marinum]|uniref:Peptide/nickel transport system permease protein n=1 Tax=Roseibium marinum TaxID=281252 RepID=A0A2S3UKC5_9HYPH|nr:ABC transporter permease [Roseibium marinum]POF28131.1 peptide/nickel transport system permease protein [Roseibium marinum]